MWSNSRYSFSCQKIKCKNDFRVKSLDFLGLVILDIKIHLCTAYPNLKLLIVWVFFFYLNWQINNMIFINPSCITSSIHSLLYNLQGKLKIEKIHNTVNKNKGDGYTCFPNINIHNFMSHELLWASFPPHMFSQDNN